MLHIVFMWVITTTAIYRTSTQQKFDTEKALFLLLTRIKKKSIIPILAQSKWGKKDQEEEGTVPCLQVRQFQGGQQSVIPTRAPSGGYYYYLAHTPTDTPGAFLHLSSPQRSHHLPQLSPYQRCMWLVPKAMNIHSAHSNVYSMFDTEHVNMTENLFTGCLCLFMSYLSG